MLSSRKNLLLLDATYLCHRARHSTGGLSHNGRPTGVAFGVLRDIETLSDLFDYDAVVWAFDHRRSFRKEHCPTYKRKRDRTTAEDRIQLECFYEEVDRLKDDLLPRCGYKNIFCFEGYEADDIIAVVAKDCDGTIVSADNDLWQCLHARLNWYSPATKKIITTRVFWDHWGIDPYQWADVKAIAGCTSDNVKGVAGVGEKTAAKYVAGLLTSGRKMAAIRRERKLINRNKALVTLPLPFDKIELPEIVLDEVTSAKKMLVREELGIRRRR